MIRTGAGSWTVEEIDLTATGEDEAFLSRRAAAGNEAAVAQLVKTHKDAVYRIVAAYLGRGEAEDATQEVFVLICSGLAKFEGRSQLRTWIYRIATNVALKRLRTRRRKPPPASLAPGVEPSAAEPGPPAGLEQRELREKFREALGQLSDDHRAVVVLRGIEGLPFEEVSRILEIPVPTAQSRMARAKDHLRELLSGYMGDEARVSG